MCDYSLHAVASRPAKVGEMLVTTSFYGTSTRGFAAKEEPGVAVCLLPGTELAFESDVRYNRYWMSFRSTGFRVARFCRIQPRAPEQHHDALAFGNSMQRSPNGRGHAGFRARSRVGVGPRAVCPAAIDKQGEVGICKRKEGQQVLILQGAK